MLDGQRALAYAVTLAIGVAGYLDAPAWLILGGAACLALEAWGLHPERRVRTSKAATYLVTGVVADIALLALTFAAGRVLRMLLA